jgi:mannose-1-phosphate guanylyltransferase
MLLCAGLGTRLRPLTDERPKPLVPVASKPLGHWCIDALRRHGVKHIVANAHHLAEQIDPGLRGYTDALGLTLHVLHERTILGTGGGIRQAVSHLGGGDFFVFNGDVLSTPDLTRAMQIHQTTGALMTMVLREDVRAEKAGVIEVTEDHRVVRILNEGASATVPTKRCLFTGIYVLSSAIFDDLPEEGCVVRHTLRRLLARGARVSGVVDDAPWFDLGTPAAYLEANLGLLRGTLKVPGWEVPSRASVVCENSVVHDSVHLQNSVVGPNAHVHGNGTFSECIVWDGAHAEAPAHRMIVSRSHRISVL